MVSFQIEYDRSCNIADLPQVYLQQIKEPFEHMMGKLQTRSMILHSEFDYIE